jgi:hypothetical protein
VTRGGEPQIASGTNLTFDPGSLAVAAGVLIPAALAAVYYFLIAADQDIAEFRFVLRAVEPVRTEMGGNFQGNIALSPVSVDSYAVVQYLGSRDILEAGIRSGGVQLCAACGGGIGGSGGGDEK